MSLRTTPRSPEEIERIAAQLQEQLHAGLTYGDILGVTEAELEAAYAVAHRFYEVADYEQAERMFNLLVINDPFDKRFGFSLGATLQMQGKYDDAIVRYGMSSLLDPKDPQPCYHTAECLLHKGERQDALDMLDICLDRAKDPAHDDLRQRALALQQLLRAAPMGAAAA
jgi:type III secretion system low calcium response chaperone LcrH/SycD